VGGWRRGGHLCFFVCLWGMFRGTALGCGMGGPKRMRGEGFT
jgi:hypothetical protein